ncbi:ribonuclease H-like protein [Aulographum hederae CBS 113979]|uniref:poly(A)-specific ribonuclease n=1 Tax=Aulographum hederae CBS 113979 TaxID=1176131 RepID=A0A6G1GJA5_9PEZI|nr:ribonuclease H-like protein [Aulographum hederae CBS 113979]
MKPNVNRFAPQNLSNPFQHLNQHNIHQQQQAQQQQQQQQQQLHHQNNNVHAQNLTGHPAFGANQAGVNIFGPQSGNAGLQGGFGGGLAAGGTGLASHAAQMGFAHGAAMQEQRDAHGAVNPGKPSVGVRVREVWKNNLHQEMAILRNLIEHYPYISMDTEFPGVVARPMGDFNTKASYHYQTLRCNVDLLKMISLGITLFSADGENPPSVLHPHLVPRTGPRQTQQQQQHSLIECPTTWTFNFQFSLDEDMYAEDSIDMLKKAGADFAKHAEMGIPPREFGSLLISSGMVMDDDVHWISFHSGYDFAYLFKMMWAQQLPADENEYRNLVQRFFPSLLDVKFLLRHAQKKVSQNAMPAAAAAFVERLGTKSGLQDIADELNCIRIGTAHQAGSDAWLTGLVFFAMRDKIFLHNIPDEMNGQMWGLTGVGAPASAAIQQAVLAAQGHGQQQQQQQGGHGHGGHGAHGHFHMGAKDPSTPTGHTPGLASSTPGPQGASSGSGHMTPGGAFGNFSYGGAR